MPKYLVYRYCGFVVECGWFTCNTVDGRNPFRTTLKPWLKPLVVGICRGVESETRDSEFGGAEKKSAIHSMAGVDLGYILHFTGDSK